MSQLDSSENASLMFLGKKIPSPFSASLSSVQSSLHPVEKLSEFASTETFANRKRLTFIEESIAHAKLQVRLLDLVLARSLEVVSKAQYWINPKTG